MKNLGVFLAGLVLAFALAQSSSLSLDLKAFRVVLVEGKENFVQAVQNRPNDVLEWRLVAENRSNAPLQRVGLVIPIPKATAYIDGSALPLSRPEGSVAPQFSFDGGITYGLPPLRKKVKVVENNREVEREVLVKPEEYTHARWVVPALAPAEKLELKLRTRVR